jgi:hypothetical protein
MQSIYQRSKIFRRLDVEEDLKAEGRRPAGVAALSTAAVAGVNVCSREKRGQTLNCWTRFSGA